MLSYPDLRRRMDGERPRVLSLVVAAEARLAAGMPLGSASLPEGAGEQPFSPRVWDAWVGNTAKLRGVKRLDDAPYATHPTRMAQLCYWLLPESEREASAILALLHDYLEEGDGFSPASIEAMRRRFPTEPEAITAAVLLSEPEISYERLGSEKERWLWQRIAYVVQADAAIRRPDGQRFANAALMDKMDNLHDLDYIVGDRHSSVEKRTAKLALRLAYFRFVAAALGGMAAPGLGPLLGSAVASRAAELGVPEAMIAANAADMDSRHRLRRADIEALIAAFHADLEL